MTSVASFGSASTAGNFTLIFSGVRLGDWVDVFKSDERRLGEIAERQNFWSTNVILDGGYPAFVFDHEFVLYTESGSLEGYLKRYLGFNGHNTSRPQPLKMHYGDTSSPVVDFGNCYLKGRTQEEPSDLLQHRAGKIRLQFTGTLAPTVVA